MATNISTITGGITGQNVTTDGTGDSSGTGVVFTITKSGYYLIYGVRNKGSKTTSGTVTQHGCVLIIKVEQDYSYQVLVGVYNYYQNGNGSTTTGSTRTTMLTDAKTPLTLASTESGVTISMESASSSSYKNYATIVEEIEM